MIDRRCQTVICHLSLVTCHLPQRPTATATDPASANFPIMRSFKEYTALKGQLIIKSLPILAKIVKKTILFKPTNLIWPLLYLAMYVRADSRIHWYSPWSPVYRFPYKNSFLQFYRHKSRLETFSSGIKSSKSPSISMESGIMRGFNWNS